MKSKIVHILFIGFVCLSFSHKQKNAGWEVSSKEEFTGAYDKATAWFSKNMNYKVNVTYASFSDHNTVNAYEKSDGFYKRNKNYIHSSALGITTIQNEKMCITVDSLNALIVLNNKKQVNQTPVDLTALSELLNNVKSIKKQIVTSTETTYQLEFKPNSTYSSYELKINDKGLLVGMKYFFSKEVKKEEGETTLKGKPRIEVTFSNYQTNVNFAYEKEFSEKIFFKEENKKIVLNEKYKKFELKDYRFAVKN